MIDPGKRSLLLAVVLGLCAGLLTFLYFQQNQASQGPSETFLAAKGTLKKGMKFSEKNITTRKMPGRYASPNAVRLKDRSNVLGLPASVDIGEGQILLWEYVEAGLESGGLSDRLSRGERAFTLAVDAVAGLAGMIQPNDRVDVIGTFTTFSGGSEKTITQSLNQNVTVLAVGSRLSRGEASSYSTVTVKVTPQEAEILAFAADHGKLRLLLRNRSDLDILEDLPEVNFSNILTEGQKAASMKAKKKLTVTYQ